MRRRRETDKNAERPGFLIGKSRPLSVADLRQGLFLRSDVRLAGADVVQRIAAVRPAVI